MLTTVFERIDRFNAAHPWSHNDFYHRWLLRQLPARLSSTLDIGCGTGNLVRALASRADIAEGIDPDQACIDLARELSAGYPNATFDVRGLLDARGDSQWDAVTAIAVVHHLGLAAALERMRSLLAPGGTLVVVGCYRAATRVDRLVDVVAIPANLVLGLLKSAGAREANAAMAAPTSPPQATLAEVRAVTSVILPGAHFRRRLFWRYSLVYTSPSPERPPFRAGLFRRNVPVSERMRW